MSQSAARALCPRNSTSAASLKKSCIVSLGERFMMTGWVTEQAYRTQDQGSRAYRGAPEPVLLLAWSHVSLTAARC